MVSNGLFTRALYCFLGASSLGCTQAVSILRAEVNKQGSHHSNLAAADVGNSMAIGSAGGMQKLQGQNGQLLQPNLANFPVGAPPTNMAAAYADAYAAAQKDLHAAPVGTPGAAPPVDFAAVYADAYAAAEKALRMPDPAAPVAATPVAPPLPEVVFQNGVPQWTPAPAQPGAPVLRTASLPLLGTAPGTLPVAAATPVAAAAAPLQASAAPLQAAASPPMMVAPAMPAYPYAAVAGEGPAAAQPVPAAPAQPVPAVPAQAVPAQAVPAVPAVPAQPAQAVPAVPAQPAPAVPVYTAQPQYAPQSQTIPNFAPQLQAAPVYAPQPMSGYAPQPQVAPQAVSQVVPQVAPQVAPQPAPQAVPLQAAPSQAAPQVAPKVPPAPTAVVPRMAQPQLPAAAEPAANVIPSLPKAAVAPQAPVVEPAASVPIASVSAAPLEQAQPTQAEKDQEAQRQTFMGRRIVFMVILMSVGVVLAVFSLRQRSMMAKGIVARFDGATGLGLGNSVFPPTSNSFIRARRHHDDADEPAVTHAAGGIWAMKPRTVEGKGLYSQETAAASSDTSSVASTSWSQEGLVSS